MPPLPPPSDPLTADHSTAVASSRGEGGPERGAIPTLTVLSHPDLDRVGECAVLGELARNRTVELSRRTPRFLAPRSGAGTPLADPFLSRSPWHLEPVSGEAGDPAGLVYPLRSIRLTRGGSPMPLHLDGRPVEDRATVSREELEGGVVLELAGRVALVLRLQEPPPDRWPRSFGLVGESAAMLRVRQAIERLAGLETPVLVTGETGTGKELVARAVHRVSRRKSRRFVAVNLGALTPSLAAAELFGSRRGAYTGATADRPGLFGQADGGTLFLDEIGEAPPEVQAMLLRTLETGEVLPVGSEAPRRVDVLVIAATDADLDRGMAEGTFKAPLLHRLAGYRIHLPPLAARREDVGRLLVHFLRTSWEETGTAPPAGHGAVPPLPPELASRLARHPFPGNVRELANVVRQMVVESRGHDVLRVSPDLDRLLPAARTPAPDSATGTAVPASGPPARRRRKPAEIPEDEIEEALRTHRWEIKAAARELGIPRTSLSSLMERSDRLPTPADVDDATFREAVERHGEDPDTLVEALQLSERTVRRHLKRLLRARSAER